MYWRQKMRWLMILVVFLIAIGLAVVTLPNMGMAVVMTPTNTEHRFFQWGGGKEEPGKEEPTEANHYDVTKTPQKRLYLWGGGKMPNEARDDFIKLAGGKVVIITSAARDQADAASVWIGRPNVVIYSQESDLDDASGVWMSGGDQLRLLKAQAHLRDRLRAMYERGVLFGGTSAGSSAVSRIMVYEDSEEEGFGLTELVVDQHFAQRRRLERLQALLARHKSLSGIGIDEGTGLILIDSEAAVVGGGVVTYCGSGRAEEKYRSGTRFSIGK
jgi:cyanophycinase